jgi:hypothetical protein
MIRNDGDWPIHQAAVDPDNKMHPTVGTLAWLKKLMDEGLSYLRVPGGCPLRGLVEIIVRLLLRPTARNMTSAMGTNVILSCWVGSIGAPI